MYILCIQTQKQNHSKADSKRSPYVVALHTHIELTRADTHACTNRGTHPASRGELICAVHVRCSQWPSCRQTAQHNTTQWLICPMKNEQAGLQSAHCAPLNVSTSSHSLSVCPFLTMWPFLFAFLLHSFLSFTLSASLLILSIPVTFLSACRPNFFFLSPWRHLAPSIALSVADISKYD